MNQLPFQEPQVGSELAIVKAGFDTDNDGKGEFLCAYTDYDENYIDMNGIASIKTQYVTNLIDQGTLGTGKYFKAHIDISNFKRTIKFELLKDAV